MKNHLPINSHQWLEKKQEASSKVAGGIGKKL